MLLRQKKMFAIFILYLIFVRHYVKYGHAIITLKMFFF